MEIRRVPVAAALALMSILACDDSPSGIPAEEERPGILEFYHDSPRIEVPAEVMARQEVQISVQTYGGGCVRGGRTEVEFGDHKILVRPFDIHVNPGPNVFCTDILQFFDHSVTVEFDAIGPHTVEVMGLRIQAGPDQSRLETPVGFQYTITVLSEG